MARSNEPISTATYGTSVSLAKANKIHGDGTAQTIIVFYIANLDHFVGKGTISQMQIDELAGLILSEYYYLKITELAMFFKRAKLGHYGELYGKVNPLWVMTALRRFKSDRDASINAYEVQREREEQMKKREQWSREQATQEQIEEIKARLGFNDEMFNKIVKEI